MSNRRRKKPAPKIDPGELERIAKARESRAQLIARHGLTTLAQYRAARSIGMAERQIAIGVKKRAAWALDCAERRALASGLPAPLMGALAGLRVRFERTTPEAWRKRRLRPIWGAPDEPDDPPPPPPPKRSTWGRQTSFHKWGRA
jgi:hypothetical protein